MRHAILLLALALLALPARALHFFADPPFLHVQGRVVAPDRRVFGEAMEEFKGKIDTVVLHHSPGGHADTGRHIGKTIRMLGLRTVVSGRCMSACANMFLGGKERLFSASMHAQPTVLGYHGTYRGGDVQTANEWAEYFPEMTDGKIPEALLERFTSLERRSGALYLIHPAQRPDESSALAFLCLGVEDPKQRDKACEKLNTDALAAGFVTSWNAAKTPPAPPFPKDRLTSKNW